MSSPTNYPRARAATHTLLDLLSAQIWDHGPHRTHEILAKEVLTDLAGHMGFALVEKAQSGKTA